MSTIDLKLKTYDELTFEITRLNTDKYLLEQKLQQKENIIKEVREYIDKYSRYCSNKEYFSTRNPITDLKIILDKGE